MNKKLLSSTGLLIAAVVLLSVNILSNATLKSLRADLTANSLYTLSDGTKRILGKLQEPVTLRLFFSRKLAAEKVPTLLPYAQRVEELLRAYESRSGGKLRLEVSDPEPFSEIEDDAVGFGLQGAPLGPGENLYFGLAGTNSIDAQDTIPFFDERREQLLEYDLTKLVVGLANPVKKVVGVLSTLPVEGAIANPMQMRQMPQPWQIMGDNGIRQFYEVKTIMPNASEIPEDVAVLLVIHPKELSEQARYAIDQYVLGGGHAMIFVDPFCEEDQPPQDPQNPMAAMTAPRASDLPDLFKAWGIELEAGQIAADRTAATSVRVANRGRQEIIPYVVYLELSPDYIDGEEVATSELNLVRMGTPGALKALDDATTTLTPLMFTSEAESASIPVSQVQFMSQPQKLLTDFFPDGQRRTLAARITGQVSSAFPGGKPADPNADEDAPADDEGTHLAESAEPINVIVVADADMLADRWWIQVQSLGGMQFGIPTADNASFVLNSIEFLTGTNDLISLRSRAGHQRPFEVVQELQRKAEDSYRAEEQRLTDELTQAEQRINELQSQKEGQSALLLSPEQQAEIERIREEQIRTRKELRRVRRNLDKDIERLGTSLKFVNILLIPLIVVGLALGLGIYKANRRKSN